MDSGSTRGVSASIIVRTSRPTDGEVVKLRLAKRARRAAGRAGPWSGPGVGRRLVAAVAAKGMHVGIIEPGGGRAKAPVLGKRCGRERGARIGGSEAFDTGLGANTVGKTRSGAVLAEGHWPRHPPRSARTRN